MAECRGFCFEPNRVYSSDELIEIIPKLSIKKLRIWMSGGKGKDGKRAFEPLKTFRDGDTILSYGDWINDFLRSNGTTAGDEETDGGE